MKTTKIQLHCDYCEQKSRAFKSEDNRAWTRDGWKQSESETICPDCRERKSIAKEKVGARLQEVFKFKNIKRTSDALRIASQNLTNLNTGRAGDGIKHLSIVLIALAEALPLKKRRKILSNIDFLLDN